MNKIGIYVTSGLIILFLLLFITVAVLKDRLDTVKAERDRLEYNYQQLSDSTQEHLSLILKIKEFLMVDSLKIDSLSKALKIRPKTIIQYIEVTNTINDTVPKIVYVNPLNLNDWLLVDTGDCFTWKGDAMLIDDSLRVSRISFDYKNNTKQIFFWEREKRFLFIHYGKKRYYQKVLPECGEAKTLNINIFKK